MLPAYYFLQWLYNNKVNKEQVTRQRGEKLSDEFIRLWVMECFIVLKYLSKEAVLESI